MGLQSRHTNQTALYALRNTHVRSRVANPIPRDTFHPITTCLSLKAMTHVARSLFFPTSGKTNHGVSPESLLSIPCPFHGRAPSAESIQSKHSRDLIHRAANLRTSTSLSSSPWLRLWRASIDLFEISSKQTKPTIQYREKICPFLKRKVGIRRKVLKASIPRSHKPAARG